MSAPRRGRRDNFVHPYQLPATRPARSFYGQMNYPPPISDFRFGANRAEQQSAYPLAYQSQHNHLDSPQSSFQYYYQNTLWRPPVQPPILSQISAFVLQNLQWTPPVQHSVPPSFFAPPSTQASIPRHFKTPIKSRNSCPNQSIRYSSQIGPLKFHQKAQTKKKHNCSSPRTSAIVSSTPFGTRPYNLKIEMVQFPSPDMDLVVKDPLKTFNNAQKCTNPCKRKRKKKSNKNKIRAHATSNKNEKEEKVDLYKKHMVKDPWMKMKPVVGFIVKQWVHHDSMFGETKRNILKNEEAKWKCEEGLNVESEMSLADCLEASFEEASRGM